MELFENYLQREIDTLQSGASVSPVPAADDGYTLDTTTYDNSITGIGKMAVAVFPADTAVFAVALEGDAFPRVLLAVDSSDYVGLALGDGTIDPTSGNTPYIGTAGVGGKSLALHAGAAGEVTVSDGLISSTYFRFNHLRTNTVIAASTPGTVVKKLEIFDQDGVSLGYIAIYDAIT